MDVANSGHPDGKLSLTVLESSEADQAVMEVLSFLIEDGFSLQASKLNTMKSGLIEAIQKGSATVKNKGDSGS